MATLSKNAQIMDALAELLEYPDDSLPKKLEACISLLKTDEKIKKAADHLTLFQDYAQANPAQSLEEAFTQAFDFNKEAALEVGWHLYGEDYARGDFLVKMRDLLRQGGVEEKQELPDHLTYVLSVVGRMDKESSTAFASMYLMSALNKMLKGIEKKEGPYQHVLKAIHFVVLENYADPLQIPGETRYES